MKVSASAVSDIPYMRLRVFYYVARRGNFSKAAQDLHVTKGAVSQQIKDLELRIGIKLFERSSGRFLVTPEGQYVLDMVAPIVDRYEALGQELELMNSRLRGRVTIVSTTAILLYLFPDYAEKFKRLHPECDIVLINQSSKEVRSTVLSGEADMGIGSVGALPDQITGKELWVFDRYLVTPLGHPLSRKKHPRYDDVAKYPVILADLGGTGGQFLENSLRSFNPDFEVAMEAANWEVAMKYVQLGYGISIIPGIAIGPKSRKDLYIRNLTKADKRVGISRYGVLLRKGKYLSPAARELIEVLSGGCDK